MLFTTEHTGRRSESQRALPLTWQAAGPTCPSSPLLAGVILSCLPQEVDSSSRAGTVLSTTRNPVPGTWCEVTARFIRTQELPVLAGAAGRVSSMLLGHGSAGSPVHCCPPSSLTPSTSPPPRDSQLQGSSPFFHNFALRCPPQTSSRPCTASLLPQAQPDPHSPRYPGLHFSRKSGLTSPSLLPRAATFGL